MSGEFTGPTATAWGVFYPKGYVVAVIDDETAAQQCKRAMEEAGFAPEDVRVFDAQWVLDNHNAFMQQRSTLQHVESLFASDESTALEQYLAEAQLGVAFITIHATEQKAIELARRILIAHRAHAIKHYGRLALTDLAP